MTMVRGALAGAAFLAFSGSPAALAAIPASLFTASDAPGQGCKTFDSAPLDFVICDDGVPAFGGTTANTACAGGEPGCKAITVPAEYGGDGFSGLPAKKTPTAVPGADGDGNIALDVDISWPRSPPPADGYPILFFMHGCCGGTKASWEERHFDFVTNADGTLSLDGDGQPRPLRELWHYNNAWFASRGYVVVNYTARGFATIPNDPFFTRRGSTGETQLDSRRFEINDFQSLACQIHANAANWNTINGQVNKINPDAVVVTGGSYGGGFSWMALTDPVWTCNGDSGSAGVTMKLAAVAPKYGWTDLVHSLVPTGRHSALPSALPATDGCDSGAKKADGGDCAEPVPAGVPKQSINAGLYGTGTVGTGPGSNATTFPQQVHEAQACLSGTYPPENNPACGATLEETLPEFLADRSAYYQQHWFDRIAAGDADYIVPIFSAATLTDPLFPPVEHRRMHNRILAVRPSYPLQAYFGDYQHFVQNKGKEWGDLCGEDRHVCTNEDFAGDFNADPATLRRTGITTRLNRFIDRYARPAGNPSQAKPRFDVTAALQVCPQKATETQAADEPGPTFSAATFEALSNGKLELDSGGGNPTLLAGTTGGLTTSAAGGGLHADPVVTNQTAPQNANRQCSTRRATDPAPSGVAQYTTAPLAADVTMLGTGVVTVTFAADGDTGSVQLNARLYEVLPDGSAVLADRGYRRLSPDEAASGAIAFELFGNGWRFTAGNRLRLELAQDDAPYLKSSAPPSGLSISRVRLSLSTRSGSGGGVVIGGGGGSALALVVVLPLLLLAGLRRRRF